MTDPATFNIGDIVTVEAPRHPWNGEHCEVARLSVNPQGRAVAELRRPGQVGFNAYTFPVGALTLIERAPEPETPAPAGHQPGDVDLPRGPHPADVSSHNSPPAAQSAGGISPTAGGHMARKLRANRGADGEDADAGHTDATRSNNVQARGEALKESLEELYQLDCKIKAAIAAHVQDHRDAKGDIMKRLREDFNMPSALVRARYVAFRIERQAEDAQDDVTLDAIHELFELAPTGQTANMVDALDRADARTNGTDASATH